MKKLILLFLIFACSLHTFATECNTLISYNYYQSKEVDSIIIELKTKLATNDLDIEKWICTKRLLSSALSRKGHYILAIIQLQETLEKITPLTMPLSEGLIYIELGNAHKLADEYALAIENYLKGIKTLEANKEWEVLFIANINIAEYYRKAAQYKMANNYLDNAFALYESHQLTDLSGYAKATGRKAAILNEMGQSRNSMQYSREVISYGQKNNNVYMEAMAHNEIGASFYNQGYPDSAIHHYTIAEQLWQSQGPSIDAAQAMFNKAMCFSYNTDDRDSSILLFRNLEKYIKVNELNYPLHKIYKHLFKEFERVKMYDSAIHYQRKRYKAFSAEEMKRLDNRIYEIQESYQNEKVVAEKQKAENELEQSNIEIIQSDYRNRMLLIFSFLILTILLILTIFFYKQRNSNRLLKDKNNEKDILLKEIIHRVKNNMQMVSSLLDLQSGKVKDDKSKEALKEAGERIKALAFAHQKLYLNDDFKNINFKNYLNLIIENLLLNSNCNFKLNFPDNYIMDIEKSQALGFIVNELITNSIKYAWTEMDKKQNIFIDITGDNTHKTFTYQDDGLGLPENFNDLKKNSLGFTLIDSFVKRQLNGTLEYVNNNGCQIIIKFNDDNFVI